MRRLWSLLRRRRLESELADEIQQHIALRTRALVDEGLDPREAAYEARRMFGNPTIIREETRDMWGYRWLDTLVQDTRFGARLLRRSPAFTVAAVASLAIGIGSAAAVFGLADALLFRTLAVRAPHELVLFRWISGPDMVFNELNGYGSQSNNETSSTSFSKKAYEEIRRELAPDADVIGFADLYRTNVAVDGRPETAFAQVVSGNYFPVLGIDAVAGRLLDDGDDRRDAPGSAVLSHAFWLRRFGGATDVIGKPILLNGVSFTIVGVMPRGFNGTLQVAQDADLLVPLARYGELTRASDPEDPNFWWVLMMARLKTGGAVARVQGAADTVLKQSVMAAKPDVRTEVLPRLRLEPGGHGQVENRDAMRQPFQFIAGVVAIVLLVACANVANLLLARGRARARELAVRAAIGAPRLRIVRQLVTEGLLLGMIASVAGLLVAQWIASALLPALGGEIQDYNGYSFAIDGRTVWFTCGLALGCTLLFALLPSVRSTDARLTGTLQEGSRGSIRGGSRFGAAGTLVIVQVALSLLLVTAAALLGWSVHKLASVDPGFNTQNLLTFGVDASLNGYDEVRTRTFLDAALERIRSLPGVSAASITSHRLIANSSGISMTRRVTDVPPPAGTAEAREFAVKRRTWRLTVDEQFHETLGIPLLRGSGLPGSLAPDGERVAVINVALAQQLFGRVDVIGEPFVLRMQPEVTLRVVGVVADARYTAIRRDPPPTVYLPFQQSPINRAIFNVRTTTDPMSMAATVREALREVDATLPLYDMRTQEQQIERSLAQERLFARLSILLGGVALALSGIGVYGLLAYTVTRRTPEIGVRMALGAERSQMAWMVVRQSILLVIAGLVLGIPGALYAARYLESLLFGLQATDPRAIAVAAAVLLAVALGAAYMPARRASRVDPLVALRTE
jgi:predicted permease